jgi:uncharacterized membrane protein YkvA (DUF1232 family)
MQMPTVGQRRHPPIFSTHICSLGGVCDKTSWTIRDVVDVFETWADHSAMSQRARSWARLVKRDVHAIYCAAHDPRVPWYAKALAICVAGYALSPIDLIPDFVPILGYMDDIIIVPLGILIVVKLIPPEIMAEHRAVAASAQDRPVSRTAALVIAIVWTACIGLAGWLCYRAFVS